VIFYGGDKALIKAVPWPSSHSFFMEAKEHTVLMLILLSTLLPILASGGVVKKAATRAVVLWTSGLIVLMALASEGVKAALLANS